MSLWTPRYNAPGFSSLFRMLDDFDRYTQEALDRPMSGALANGVRGFNPKFDVAEHEKAYSLQGELAGVPPENIVIEFTDPQTLVVRGHAERLHTEGDPSLARIEGGKESEKIEAAEKASPKTQDKKETDKPKAKYWLSERSFGEFSRVFNFPTSVDQENVEAKFEHGILNITVPKVEKKGARKIAIKQ